MNLVLSKKCNLAQKQFVRVIYSFLVQLAWFHLRLIAKFNHKIKLFVNGRKRTFPVLENALAPSDKTIWMHVASLGEYEQGLPLLEKLKAKYPNHKLLLTFFSPSGYQVKKGKTPADVVVYLPMDTLKNAKVFLDMVNPRFAIFIKYEIWPNYLHELQKRGTATLLVSGIFSKKQVYFKWFGSFMRKSLRTFSHFFVQEGHSKELLKSIGFQNVTVSGDTRFDRVNAILERDNTLDFMEGFKGDSLCFVAGSTWPEDERILVKYINSSTKGIKFVLAPHNIKTAHIENLKTSIDQKVLCYSELTANTIADIDVLIVDTIGLLTKIYSYADFTYVGGGFATGLHNTLEPAVFGVPVIFGPKYHNFNEAVDLVNLKGGLSVKDQNEFDTTMERLLSDPDLAIRTGNGNIQYIQRKIGATQTVMQYIGNLI